MKRRETEDRPTCEYYNHALVRAVMAVRGWTDRDVAGRMGAKQSSFNRIKLGRVPDLKLSTVHRLAGALEVEPKMLLDPDATVSTNIEYYQVKQHRKGKERR